MATEIIVYRNPLEKAMWDFWTGPTGGPIFMWGCIAVMALLAGYVLYAILHDVVTRFYRRRRVRRNHPRDNLGY